MLSGTVLVDRRFGLLRAIAYVLRALAALILLASLMLTLLMLLSVSAITQAPAFVALLSLPALGGSFLGAMSVAMISETILVLLAIEENTRAGALAALATAQAQQKQPDLLAEIQKIAQNSRFAADDLLKIGQQATSAADDLRRIIQLLAGRAGGPTP